MGFSTIFDVLGSMIIGGILLQMIINLNDSATEKTINNSGELSLQQNLTTVAQIIENDFRKIGYCAEWYKYPDPSKAVLYADTSEIKFITDVDADGNIDSIHYVLGDPSELEETPNPRDRLLYRLVNNKKVTESNLGITQFHLIFFDALGDTITPPITTPGLVSSLEINLTVENTAAYDTAYSNAFWKQIRLVARNLKNR
ncbi:MAG: hypothetical protein Kow0098_24230 [Ignavibacteriaceae bacterium]